MEVGWWEPHLGLDLDVYIIQCLVVTIKIVELGYSTIPYLQPKTNGNPPCKFWDPVLMPYAGECLHGR